MRDSVSAAIRIMEESGGVALLQQHSTLERRYKELSGLLPEIQNGSSPIVKRQIIFHIQHRFNVEMGVCQYYSIDDHAQFCLISGNKKACACAVPQGFCMWRDKDNEPRYPEFTPCLKLVRRCPSCDHWLVCMKIQLDHTHRRKFNENHEILRTPESFFRFVAEECDHFRYEAPLL